MLRTATSKERSSHQNAIDKLTLPLARLEGYNPNMRLPSFPIPVASFASVIGIVALGLDWRATGQSGDATYAVGDSLIGVGGLVFAILLILWGMRIASKPNEVAVEFNNPITASLFGTIVISTSLLAAGALPRFVAVATVLWAIATISGLTLVLLLFARWMERGIQAFELTPVVYAPIVGNATTAFAGVPLGFGEIAWFSYSAALVLWLSIGPIVFYRLMVVEPRLPRKMAPQLGLLISSPAVLAGGWYALNGSADAVFKLLAFDALFLGLLVLRLWRVGWGEPFNVATWGWAFPTAELAGTFGRASRTLPDSIYGFLGWVTLGVATLTVFLCTLAAVRGWVRKIVSVGAPTAAHDG
jgi:tellurite resistance protein TehA-like permease